MGPHGSMGPIFFVPWSGRRVAASGRGTFADGAARRPYQNSVFVFAKAVTATSPYERQRCSCAAQSARPVAGGD